MGESDRYTEYKAPKKRLFTLGEDGNSLVALVVLNIVCFLILLVIQVSYSMGDKSTQLFNAEFLQWIALPDDGWQFLQRPWTIVTYVISDSFQSFVRLFTNMIWLWAFGSILQRTAGNDKLIPVYFYGGILGAIFFITAHLFLSAETAGGGWLLGANTGVLAVALAATTLEPNFKLFAQIRGGVSLWIFTVIYLLIDLSGIQSNGMAYSLSHLGAAFAGFLFIFFLRRGYDGSIWMNKFYHKIINLFNPVVAKTRNGVKDKYFYKTGNRTPYTRTPVITEDRINEILDKINLKGVNSLTKEEKEILAKASENKEL